MKVVTEQEVTTTTTTTVEEKYRVNAPESMQETFLSDSEDEGGKSVFFLSVDLHEALFILISYVVTTCFFIYFHVYTTCFYFSFVQFFFCSETVRKATTFS